MTVTGLVNSQLEREMGELILNVNKRGLGSKMSVFVMEELTCESARRSELSLCPQGPQKGQSTTSCPTLRHFHEAWRQTTEGSLWGPHWA